MATRSRVLPTVIAGATGALAAFFADPQNGRRRRIEATQRGGRMARRTVRMVNRTARFAEAEVEGRARGAVHAMTGRSRPVANEETLADRVRSELFRDNRIPKGALNINVERECVVVLRGEVQRSEQIQEIEERVRDIPGVRDVENLMHTPGSPAPMHSS